MTIYVILGIGLLYLTSHILNFKKVPLYKRKYLLLLDVVLVIGLIMGILGLLFPTAASSRFAMITTLLIILMAAIIIIFIFFKISKIEKRRK